MCRQIYPNLLQLQILPVLALTTYFDINQLTAAREVSAAVVNISGRQRMLSQRTALLCLRMVCSQDKTERASLHATLQTDINLMEKSHNGLINGDPSLNLIEAPSPAVKAIYFKPPLHLDLQVRNYIAQVRALLQTEDTQLTPDNLHLQYILTVSSTNLLDALDAVVSQYEKESDLEQLGIDLKQAELYQNSCAATAVAQAQAQQLEKALRDLQQTQAQLIHTERMSSLGQLVAGVAHEINNPVNFIYGNLSYASEYVKKLLRLLHLYQDHYPNPNLQIQNQIEAIDLDFLLDDLPKVLSSMKVGAERIQKIVLSLRNFSRLDESERKLVDIHEGINSTLLILQNRTKACGGYPGIKVVKEYGDLPLVECYPAQLNQVFMNILSNAIDAIEEVWNQKVWSPDSRLPDFWIRIRTEVVGDTAIAVRIADNGTGVTEEVRQRLFDPFFTTKELGKGVGLGLSISYQIVVGKHRGSLRCMSSPAKETEFWISIPLRQSLNISDPTAR